jgi:hypothetical protein
LGESIPETTVTSLDGHQVSLPANFSGKPAILVVGFSRAGGEQCGPFARRLIKEPDVQNGAVKVYQIAMLASAPRLVRPMILHGMRGGVPKEEQSTFLPLYRNEKEWKQVAGYVGSAEKDAYLLLVDPNGTVRWTGHGRYSDAAYSQFRPYLLH